MGQDTEPTTLDDIFGFAVEEARPKREKFGALPSGKAAAAGRCLGRRRGSVSGPNCS